MNPYLLVPMLACVGCAASAGMMFARSTAYGTSRAAAQILLGGAFWALCEIAWNTADDPDTALALIRASAAGWVWLGPSVTQLFLERELRPNSGRRRILAVQYGIAAVLLGVTWFTPWMHADVVRTSWGWSYQPGPAFVVFYAFTIASIAVGLLWGGQGYRANHDPHDRRLGWWLAAGLAVPIVVASLTEAILPWLGWHVPHLGSLSLAVLGLVLSGNILYFGYSVTAPWAFRQEMLSILPEGVALLGMDGRIRTANEALARLVGTSIEGVLGRSVTDLVPEAPVDPPREVRDVETRLCGPDGPRLPVAVSSTLVRDRRQMAIGQVLVVRDLREVVSLRNRLITSGRLAAVGELAASIAHEVNNPLAFIRSNIALLGSHWRQLAAAVDPARAGELAPVVREGEELIGESLEGVDRTARFVSDVKGLSHAGEPARGLEDVNRLVESVIRVANAQSRGGGRVETDFAELPLLRCARQELKQVFLNLLINAVQAIGDGGTVRVSTRHQEGAIVVRVEDDGPGIAPTVLERVFDPFFTTKPEGEGTGLGLAISKEILRRHGGSIEVESTPGEGTRFYVWLPLRSDEAPNA